MLPPAAADAESLEIAAQVQDIEARLLLSQGQAESAAVTWEAVVIAYEQSGDLSLAQQAQLSQAQALQSAGFYRRSVDLLTALTTRLSAQPPSELSVRAALSLGEAFRLTGALAEAETQFQTSLQGAESLSLADLASAVYLNLGNLTRLQTESSRGQAADYYQQAITRAASPWFRIQAQLAQLDWWIAEAHWQDAYHLVSVLWEEIATLPLNPTNVYAQIELVEHLQAIRQATLTTLIDLAIANFDGLADTAWTAFVSQTFAAEPDSLRSSYADSQSIPEQSLWTALDRQFLPLADMATRLATLRRTAQALGNAQAEATILGALGNLYEQVEDWDAAAQVTQAGLVLAQSYNLVQVTYGLQAQLGRIQLAQGDRSAAISAYQASVQTLQVMRADVVAVSSEAQYSFQKSIEPIYRELATLLLEEGNEGTSADNLKHVLGEDIL
ncbi:MAG: hypothetical protein F6K42_37440 [Leptolyngbya sp. SIO1D8]|nr:hypothetical protein [Leptolyngbya sp. SIO1D8]